MSGAAASRRRASSRQRARSEAAACWATLGEIPLTLGSAVPSLGDVTDEDPDDDGAVVAAGFASLTALRSVHEDTGTGADDAIRAALEAIEAAPRRQRLGVPGHQVGDKRLTGGRPPKDPWGRFVL